MTRPILVFGAGGRVGGELMKFAPDLQASGIDIRDEHALAHTITSNGRPEAIINLAACTLPQAANQQNSEAFDVNTRAVSWLASHGVPVVHISTDCVFSGAKTQPYVPEDAPSPVNWYGETKLYGEQEIALASRFTSAPHIIIRTTGVYLRGKPNFLETVLAKARAGETLECVSDSIYSPTDARELARAILTATERVIEDPSVSGTYHFAGPDVMSYLDFAKLVQEEAGVTGEIVPVTMADRERVEGFKRPRNASLSSDKFAEVFGLRHRPTRECVRELVNPA